MHVRIENELMQAFINYVWSHTRMHIFYILKFIYIHVASTFFFLCMVNPQP